MDKRGFLTAAAGVSAGVDCTSQVAARLKVIRDKHLAVDSSLTETALLTANTSCASSGVECSAKFTARQTAIRTARTDAVSAADRFLKSDGGDTLIVSSYGFIGNLRMLMLP